AAQHVERVDRVLRQLLDGHARELGRLVLGGVVQVAEQHRAPAVLLPEVEAEALRLRVAQLAELRRELLADLRDLAVLQRRVVLGEQAHAHAAGTGRRELEQHPDEAPAQQPRLPSAAGAAVEAVAVQAGEAQELELPRVRSEEVPEVEHQPSPSTGSTSLTSRTSRSLPVTLASIACGTLP